MASPSQPYDTTPLVAPDGQTLNVNLKDVDELVAAGWKKPAGEKKAESAAPSEKK